MPLLFVQGSSFVGILLTGVISNTYEPINSTWIIIQFYIYFFATSLDYITFHVSIVRNTGVVFGVLNSSFARDLMVQLGFIIFAFFAYIYFGPHDLGVDVSWIAFLILALSVSLMVNPFILINGKRNILYIDAIVNFIFPVSIAYNLYIFILVVMLCVISFKFYIVFIEDSNDVWTPVKHNISGLFIIKAFGVVRSYFPVFVLSLIGSSGIVDNQLLYLFGLGVRIISAASSFVGNYHGLNYIEKPHRGELILGNNFWFMAFSTLILLLMIVTLTPVYILVAAFILFESRFMLYAKNYYVAIFSQKNIHLLLVSLLLLAGMLLYKYNSIFAMLSLADMLLLISRTQKKDNCDCQKNNNC